MWSRELERLEKKANQLRETSGPLVRAHQSGEHIYTFVYLDNDYHGQHDYSFDDTIPGKEYISVSDDGKRTFVPPWEFGPVIYIP